MLTDLQRELLLSTLIDRERTVLIEAKALRKMRHPTRSKQLQAFLDMIEIE